MEASRDAGSIPAASIFFRRQQASIADIRRHNPCISKGLRRVSCYGMRLAKGFNG